MIKFAVQNDKEMLERIETLRQQLANETAATKEAVEELRIKYLSKKGLIPALMADFRTVPAELKREIGQKINELKNEAQERINALKESFESSDSDIDVDLDLTRTGTPVSCGTRHPLTLVRNEIISIFGSMGFTIAEGPEIEDDWHVFESLNFPPDHPARDMQDTFFIDREKADGFARRMFGPETRIRLRPSYFPFTEPSAEMDISCHICGGKGCALCKGTGWVEILGCGMVDPNVLKNCGIDPEVYSGYAFGMGVERIANLKYKVKDLRLFSENDVRFLKEFESAH